MFSNLIRFARGGQGPNTSLYRCCATLPSSTRALRHLGDDVWGSITGSHVDILLGAFGFWVTCTQKIVLNFSTGTSSFVEVAIDTGTFFFALRLKHFALCIFFKSHVFKHLNTLVSSETFSHPYSCINAHSVSGEQSVPGFCSSSTKQVFQAIVLLLS